MTLTDRNPVTPGLRPWTHRPQRSRIDANSALSPLPDAAIGAKLSRGLHSPSRR